MTDRLVESSRRGERELSIMGLVSAKAAFRFARKSAVEENAREESWRKLAIARY
jgi:hypothetical protein